MGQTDARVLDAIRDAATVIVLRNQAGGPSVLMGQRGHNAAFMPSKFVFPGGAVDISDAEMPLARAPHPEVAQALSHRSEIAPGTVIATATRELWEETGLLLGRPGATPGTVPDGWDGYAATGHLPDGAAFSFFFRAITPPGRTRRFDARFLLVDATALSGDLDDFSGAEDELSHLQWVPLAQARDFDLPFITEVVMAELSAHVAGRKSPGVPFFDNSGDMSLFSRI